MFVYERLWNSPNVDAARVADAIELTRFPPLIEERENAGLEAGSFSPRTSLASWRSSLPEKSQSPLL